MDFGAIQCVPKSPICSPCPLISDCVAYNTNSINNFPRKLNKIKLKKRFINYLFIQNNYTAILGKIDNGIWKGLYEFPFIEYKSDKSVSEVLSSDEWADFFKQSDYKIELVSDEFHHKLSRQHIYAKFWIVNIKLFELEKYFFVSNSELRNYPVSRLTDKFLKAYNII